MEAESTSHEAGPELAQWIAAARHDGMPDRYQAKRGEVRYRQAAQLDVRLSDTEPIQPAMLRDISNSGVALWLRNPVEQHQQLAFRFWEDATPSPWIVVRVAHCERGLLGWLVGAKMLQPISDADVEAALQTISRDEPLEEHPDAFEHAAAHGPKPRHTRAGRLLIGLLVAAALTAWLLTP